MKIRTSLIIQRGRSAFLRVLCRTSDLTRRVRLSYLPPLMVYLAAGVSGLTGIVGTFFVKDYLDLPAEFLAMLGFWVGLPWALKMPLGHLVDLIWKWKSILVFLGATLIAASLTIMLILITSPSLLSTSMGMESWFVLAAMLSPIGYVLQDVVAADYYSLGTLLIVVTTLGLLLPLCSMILVKKVPEFMPLRVSGLLRIRITP